mgnify:CR=1 FL=1
MSPWAVAVAAAVAWFLWPSEPVGPRLGGRPPQGDHSLRRWGQAGRARATHWLTARQRRRRAEALAAAVAPCLDLCSVVMGSGGTIRDCVDLLATRAPAVVRPAAAAALAQTDVGRGLDRALRSLQDDLGPAFQPLTGALLVANEQGGPVGLLLTRLSVEAMASRRRHGELQARRLPVLLLVPLVTCSLPAVVLGAVVPLALVSLRQLQL